MIDIDEKLHSLADKKYLEFNEKLTPGAKAMMGVRIPDLRKLAQEIARLDDVLAYLNSPIDDQYERLTLYGLVVTSAKIPFSQRLRYLAKFVPHINNWATCDVVCSSLKPKSVELDECWNFALRYKNSTHEYELRFMLVVMMDYCLTEKYLEEIFVIINSLEVDYYYTKMAEAWLIAEAFVKCREQTLTFLKQNQLDRFTQNKAIQKIRESYRVSTEDKKALLELKK